MSMDLTGKDYRKIENFIVIGDEVYNYHTGVKMGVLSKKEYPHTPEGVLSALAKDKAEPVKEKVKAEEPGKEDEEPKKFSMASVGFGRKKSRAEEE